MSAPKKYRKGMRVAGGEVVEFSNGALAEKRPDGRFKIVKGPNDAGMAKLHKSKRKSPKYTSRGKKNIMGKFYNKKSYSSPKRRAAAIKRDMCHKGKSVVNDTRWRQNPRKHDLLGFDDGSLCKGKKTTYKKRAATSAQEAALKAGRATRLANIKAKADQDGGARKKKSPKKKSPKKKVAKKSPKKSCGWSAKTKSCNTSSKKNKAWCQMGSKKRCVKSPLGHTKAKRRSASPAQLAALAKGRRSRAANLNYKSAVAARGSRPSPMAAMSCNKLVEDECVKHPACNFMPAKGTKKAFCKRNTKNEKRGKRSPKSVRV